MPSGKTIPFTRENVDRSPAVPGVYELIENGETIYYGRATGDGVTIRSRLQAHFNGTGGNGTHLATHYRREPCTNPIHREKQLLTGYELVYGRLPRCNSRIG